MKMAVSKRKIQANQKNALKSTGPKTQKGKSVVKWNAIKHGLLAQEIIIKKGDGQEDHLEFKSLFTQLHEDLQPVGFLEEMLVERIAICYWRLRRVIRCENGEIRRVLDNISWNDSINKIEKFKFEKKYIQLDSSKNFMLNNSIGIDFLLTELDNIRFLIEDAGYLTEEAKEKLYKYFGSDDGGITFLCYLADNLSKEIDDDIQQKKQKRTTPEKSKEVMLGFIDDHKKKLTELKQCLEENENNELDAKWESVHLPSKEAVDKILRYETTLERQLYRAIKQLELLQKKREYDFGFVS